MSKTTAKSLVRAPESGEESSPQSPLTRNNTGRVKFDDRGNAVWEWAVRTTKVGPKDTSALLERLQISALSLADDSASQAAPSRNDARHTMGYCPYDSSGLGAAEAEVKRSGKKDLRRLGEWLKLREQVARNKKAKD